MDVPSNTVHGRNNTNDNTLKKSNKLSKNWRLGLGTVTNSDIKKIEEKVKKQQLGLERQQQMNDNNKNTGMCKHELFLIVLENVLIKNMNYTVFNI